MPINAWTHYFVDEDGEIGTSKIWADQNDAPGSLNHQALMSAIKDCSAADLYQVGDSETYPRISGTPASGPYDIRDKLIIELLVGTPEGSFELRVPAPIPEVLLDSDNGPAPADLASYPLLEALVDVLIGTATPPGGQELAFGYLGCRRVRAERSR